MENERDTIKTHGRTMTVLLPDTELHAGLWHEARLHEELNIIWFYASDEWRDSLLCIPLAFTNRPSLLSAWGRLLRAKGQADLRDLNITVPDTVVERVEKLMERQQEDRQTFIGESATA